MDPNGNLYSLQGELLGQAASGDEGSEDDPAYFEDNNSGLLQQPPQRQKADPKKLPPVSGPGKRSHSP